MTSFTLPNAATVINSVTDYGNAMFAEYSITIIGTILGLTVAGLAINWLKRSGVKFLKTIFGGGKRRRRGRR